MKFKNITVVVHAFHTGEVVGSIPTAPTIVNALQTRINLALQNQRHKRVSKILPMK